MTEPSLELRARTLRAALSRRPPARRAPGFARPYAALVSMLDVLLADLVEDEWTSVAAGEWDARDLVAHLYASDGLLADAIAGTASSARDVPARTAEAVGRRLPLGETRMEWRRQADALCDGMGEVDADRRLEVGGYRLRLRDHFTARAFETWVHTDDIGRATDRDVPTPVAEHVHPMADLSARGLPLALSLIGRDHPDRVLRLVLDGPGGGQWTIPLGAAANSGAPDAQVRMDVTEFCFLAGGRRDPESVPVETSGDPAVARDVLMAASVFSGP